MTETAERLNNQAILLARDGSYKEAIACFARAITIDRNNALLWFNLGITYRDAGKLQEAKEALIKAQQIDSSDLEIVEELAIVIFQMKDYDLSIRVCMKALDLYPENATLWNTRGINFFNKGDYNEACESFETAVYLNPYYGDALFNLRDTYKKLGNKTGETECIIRLKELKKSGEN